LFCMKSLSRRRILKLLLAGLGVLLLAALAAWLFPQQVLTVDSGPIKAEVLVVLGGGSHERPDRAAELLQEEAAPRIICSGNGDCTSNRARLLHQGVPADRIQTECESKNTKENAEFTIARLRAQGVKRAIIVTTWYHSRRALNCFRHYAPDIEFYSRPSYIGYRGGPPSPERRAQKGYIRSEYVKLLGYWVRYGVGPL